MLDCTFTWTAHGSGFCPPPPPPPPASTNSWDPRLCAHFPLVLLLQGIQLKEWIALGKPGNILGFSLN